MNDKPKCPWRCGYTGQPVKNTNVSSCNRNSYKCPKCGEVGNAEDWGLDTMLPLISAIQTALKKP